MTSKARTLSRIVTGDRLANSIVAAVNSAVTQANLPAFQGDVTSSAGGNTLTLASTGVTAGSYGNTTAIPVITVDAKGRITAATTNSVSGVTGLTYTNANTTVTVSTSTVDYSANIEPGLNQAYANAVAYAASNTYVNNTFAPKAGPTFTGTAAFADVTISGNLTASGTTTYVNSTALNIGDNIITLNADLGASAPTEDAGIEVNRGTSANVALRWYEAGDEWQTTVDGTNYLTIATNNDVSTAYSNAIAYSGNAALAYANAVAYAASNTYVNTQLDLKASLSGATFTGSVSINGNPLIANSNVNGLPGTSGTSTANVALRVRGGDNAVLDFGTNSIDTWIQATDKASYTSNFYNILLNPNGGNVSIGYTSSQSYKLAVNGPLAAGNTTITGFATISYPSTNNNVDIVNLNMSGWSNSTDKYKNISWGDPSKVGAIGMAYNGSYTYMDIHSFYNGGYTSNILMRIRGDGNVLVGTTNADVGGSATGIRFTPNGSIFTSISGNGFYDTTIYADRRGANNAGNILGLALNGYWKASIGVLGTSGAGNDGGITLNTISGNDTQVERMRVSASAIYIGTSTSANASYDKIEPGTADNTGYRSNIWGNGGTSNPSFEQYVYDKQAGTGNQEVAYMTGRLNGSGKGTWNFQTKSSTSWYNTMTMLDGQVGIGNTSPSHKLSVNGTTYIAGNTTMTGALLVSTSTETGYASSLATSVTKSVLTAKPHSTDSTVTTFGAISGGDGYIQRSNGPGTGSYNLRLNPWGGAVLMPNQPAFFAAGNQSSGQSGGQVAPFNTAVLNVGSHFNTSTYRFTAPIVGVYYFTLYGIMGPDAAGHAISHIRKNGAVIASMHRNSTTSSVWEQGSCSVYVSLAAGDYVDVYIGVGGALYMDNGNYYSGFMGRLMN